VDVDTGAAVSCGAVLTDVEGRVLREDEEDDHQHVELAGGAHAVRVVELLQQGEEQQLHVPSRLGGGEKG
jgi:hypothetical protein